MVYASDPGQADDSGFVAADLRHLAAGNRGRLLDPRRTPITVVDVAPERGSFSVRVGAFEDEGARWELGLEEIVRFQFAHDAVPVSDERLAELRRGAARFDRDLSIEAEPERSAARLRRHRNEAREWLAAGRHGLDGVDPGALIEQRDGSPRLYELLDEFLTVRELDGIDRAFASAYVTNPRAGELVKGHAIIAAELGLGSYHGQAPRDPELFAGALSRARREEHLLARLAFTQELMKLIHARNLDLYRAASTEDAFRGEPAPTFVSATFSATVADAQFAGGPSTRAAVLWRQRLPVGRTLMTFLETRALNERFREAEAVLLADPSNQAF
jgi:hypothetical protein